MHTEEEAGSGEVFLTNTWTCCLCNCGKGKSVPFLLFKPLDLLSIRASLVDEYGVDEWLTGQKHLLADIMRN